jgi:membrane associated rhomboid family serine protease
MPPVTFNFLAINILLYLIKLVFQYKYDIDISEYLGLRYIKSPDYHWYQWITYLFVHANEMHILFNMFALWMFGPLLEELWGWKNFMLYYIVCGLGAAVTQEIVYYISIIDTMNELEKIHQNIMQISSETVRQQYLEKWIDRVNEWNDGIIVVGASGSIYGLLAAYGALFPNTIFYLYLIMPMKAKWVVIIFGLIELITGVFIDDNIAHFAHLGGMVVGVIWVLIWKRKNKVDIHLTEF